MNAMSTKIRISIESSEGISAIAYPAAPGSKQLATYILAHGAGGNQLSPWLVQFATAAAARGIAVVTFNFLYSEQGRGLPDKNDKLEACWRKVVEAWHDGAFAKSLGMSGGPLIIGGKSMGGRIASQIAAGGPAASPGMAEVAGLVFLGYPLHPPGKPEQLRSRHLPAIRAPMLFVQGARDAFGTPEELRPILSKLKAPADLLVIEEGDHSFKVAKAAGRTQRQVFDCVLAGIEDWLRKRVGAHSGPRGAQ
jgi:predicted alpha/beta-hydrolase family hydrolase